MPQETRTLEIVTRVRDFASRAFRTMGRTIAQVVRFSLLAPLRLLQATLRSVRTAFLGLGAAALTGFAFLRGTAAVKGIVDTADAMSKLSRSVGTTTEDLTALQVAMGFGGIEMSRFRQAVLELGRGVSQALRTGQGQQFDAFARLGISLEDLRRGNYVELFQKIAAGLQQFDSQAEKAAILQAIFSRNFQALLPLLGEGEAAFLANVRAARQFGAELSGELGQAAEDFNDELLKLTTALKSLAREGVLRALRDLQPLVQALINFVGQHFEQFASAVEAMVKLAVRAALAVAKVVLQIVAALQDGRAQRFVDDLVSSFEDLGFGLGKIASVIRGGLGIPRVSEEARELEENIRAVSDRIVALERRRSSGLDLGEGGTERLTREITTARSELDALSAAYDRLRNRIEASDTADESLFVARIRALSEELANITSLDELVARFGGPSSPIRRILEDTAGDLDKVNAKVVGFFDSFKNGLDSAIQGWKDLATAATDAGRTIVDSSLNAVVNAISEGILRTKSWREAFKELAKTILEELSRIIAKLIIVNILQGLSNLFPGGSTTSNAGGGNNGRPATSTPGTGNSFFSGGGGFGEPTALTPRLSGLGAGGPPTPVQFVFAPTVNAVDSVDAKRFLIRERHTIRALWENEMVHTNSARQAVRGVR